MRRKSFTISALLCLSLPAKAATCANEIKVEQGAIPKIIACLKILNEENERLKTEISAKPKNENLPDGVVVAFTQQCPKKSGWMPYSEASGRFILGERGYAIGSQGGYFFEARPLQVDVGADRSKPNATVLTLARESPLMVVPREEDKMLKENDPFRFYMMPPFITLKYCIKKSDE